MARRKAQWFKRGSWWRRIRLNRKYKDKLFRFLFRDKRDLLDLYNALNGTDYRDPDQLEIVTMEDVIFLKMKNDIKWRMRQRYFCPILLQTDGAAAAWNAVAGY